MAKLSHPPTTTYQNVPRPPTGLSQTTHGLGFPRLSSRVPQFALASLSQTANQTRMVGGGCTLASGCEGITLASSLTPFFFSPGPFLPLSFTAPYILSAGKRGRAHTLEWERHGKQAVKNLRNGWKLLKVAIICKTEQHILYSTVHPRTEHKGHLFAFPPWRHTCFIHTRQRWASDSDTVQANKPESTR